MQQIDRERLNSLSAHFWQVETMEQQMQLQLHHKGCFPTSVFSYHKDMLFPHEFK